MAILISLSGGWDFNFNLIRPPSKFLSAADSIPCEHTPCRFAVLNMIAVKFLALNACLPVSCKQSFVDLTLPLSFLVEMKRVVDTNLSFLGICSSSKVNEVLLYWIHVRIKMTFFFFSLLI